jgi:transposase InsO family protein
VLSAIESACSTCKRYSSKPLRLKTTLPSGEELSFGSELSMDLMFINGKSVIHVIDSATRFNAATFLDSHSESYGQSSDGIWDAFIGIWCSIFTGYPDRLRIDSGSAFTSVKWITLTASRRITLRISGVEAHNTLGIGERFHGPLRRIYQKIEHEVPHVGPALLLRIAVKP